MNPTPYDWQYLPLLMQILAAFLLGVVMVVASWFVGRHRNTKVKLDAYECGIEAVGDAQGRFSVRFYLVAILFIAPFTTIVYGGSVVLGASLAIFAQYVRPFASSGAGLLADRIGSSRVSLCGMILVTISLFSIALAPGGKGNIIKLVLLCLVLYLSMYCVYSMNYALLEEGDIPKNICGTAVGIIATLGYLPDVLVPGLGGRLLDLFPGALGYKYIFTAIAIIAVAGICIILCWIRLTAKKRAHYPAPLSR